MSRAVLRLEHRAAPHAEALVELLEAAGHRTVVAADAHTVEGEVVDLDRPIELLARHIAPSRAVVVAVGARASLAACLCSELMDDAGFFLQRPRRADDQVASHGAGGALIVDASGWPLSEVEALRPMGVVAPWVETADLDALGRLIASLPADALAVCDPRVSVRSDARVVHAGLEADLRDGGAPTWMAAPTRAHGTTQAVELFIGGAAAAKRLGPRLDASSHRAAVCALAYAAEAARVPVAGALERIAASNGVRGQLEWIGIARGVHVLSDDAGDALALRRAHDALRDRTDDAPQHILIEDASLHEAAHRASLPVCEWSDLERLPAGAILLVVEHRLRDLGSRDAGSRALARLATRSFKHI